MTCTVLKRIVDTVIASVGIVLVGPFFSIVALLIKLDSRGPAFFLQERVGKNGKLFRVYKLRTMISKAEDFSPSYNREDLSSMSFQQKDDPRITRMGKFLRRGFDELPELVNVLKGEMSLVGPRPEVSEIVQLYNEREKKRLQVKPGITCTSIICGRGDLTIQETIDYDLEYIQNQSFLLDAKILVQTSWVVLVTGRGAR